MSFQSFDSGAGSFVALSTQYLDPGTSTLISFGGWFKPWIINVSGGAIVSFNDFNIAGTDEHSIYMESTEDVVFDSTDGSTTAHAATASATWAAQDWLYFIARRITTSNSKLDVLNSRTGQFFSASSATSVSFSGADSLTLGYQGGFNGFGLNMAEFWCMMNKTFGPTTALDRSLVEQIAYRGIFSIPHLAQQVDMYVPLRENLQTYLGPILGMAQVGNIQTNFWQLDGLNTNYERNIWGQHPPLPADYVDPFQTMRLCGPFG